MRAHVAWLACLACTGLGLSGGQVEEAPSSEALATLLLAFNPIAAGHGRSFGTRNAKGNGVSSSEPALKGIRARAASRQHPILEPVQVSLERSRVPKVRGGSISMEEKAGTETFEFQAEVSKVMDIIINSLYSDKDIFLRELVSNAADACDKKRILELTESKLAYSPRIRIKSDKASNTLTIEDNGVGMTRKELQENLGRIAQSGTKKFSEALGDADESNLIGQFGVGFYSAFLVAERVEVVSKFADGPQLRWKSESANSYTISDDDSEPIENSGTRIILTMKEDADKYLDDYTIRNLLKKYSEFISATIELWAEKTEYDTVPDPDAEVKEGEPPKTKTVPRTSNVWEQVNVARPLWMRSPQEVKDDEYTEFYKVTFKQYDEPLAKMHFSLEGQVEFRAVLFLPSSLPWELSQDMFSDNVKPVKLYVKRVFISDKFSEELAPRWLSFIKGVVDSDDLPLNVSRELLQKSRVLQIIRKRVVRKAIDMLIMTSKDEKKEATMQKNFGKYIKVGLIEDRDNKDEILKIAAYESSASEKLTTLPRYVARMKEGQKKIYYVAGVSKEAAKSSPVLERLQKKGYEVIFAIDQIDEVSLQGIGKFMDFDVVDAAKESDDDEELSEEEKKETEEAKTDFEATLKFLKTQLGDRVDKVEVSTRLTTSPSALLQPKWGMSPQMQKFIKAQAAATGNDEQLKSSKTAMAANLEINPKHEVILKLKDMVSADGDSPSTQAKEFATLVYDVAAISSGWDVTDTGLFAKRVVALMGGGSDALSTMPETEAAPVDEEDQKVKELARELATDIEKETKKQEEEQKPIDPEVL